MSDDPSKTTMTEQEPLRINTSIGIQESGGPGGMNEMRRETIGEKFQRIGADTNDDGTVKADCFNCWRCCAICDAVGIGNTVWDADGLCVLCLFACNIGEACCEVLAECAQ